MLEILKLRRVRLRQVSGLRREARKPVPAAEDLEPRAPELETEVPRDRPGHGEFEAVEPD